MTKNIPGSRRARRSKLLRKLEGKVISLEVGTYVEGQFSKIDEYKGLLGYSLDIDGGKVGYFFTVNPRENKKLPLRRIEEQSPYSGRILIREIESINTDKGLIKYVIGRR